MMRWLLIGLLGVVYAWGVGTILRRWLRPRLADFAGLMAVSATAHTLVTIAADAGEPASLALFWFLTHLAALPLARRSAGA